MIQDRDTGDETSHNIRREWFKIVPDEEACGVAPEEPVNEVASLKDLAKREAELALELQWVQWEQKRLKRIKRVEEQIARMQNGRPIIPDSYSFGMDWGHPEGDYSAVTVTSKHKYYDAVLALLRQAEKEEKR